MHLQTRFEIVSGRLGFAKRSQSGSLILDEQLVLTLNDVTMPQSRHSKRCTIIRRHHGSKNDPDLARRRVPSPCPFSVSADLRARCFVTPKRFHHGESAEMQVTQFFAVLKEIQEY